MKVLFLTDGPTSPGSRYRCLQYFEHLKRRGIECTVQFAYDERYNDLVGTRWSVPYRLAGRLRRTGRMLTARGYDLLYLHKTALAFTGLPERLRALGRTPLVFDYDDAIFQQDNGLPSPRRMRAFRQIVDVADHLIPGNHYLAQVAGAPSKTTVIPTVVDTDVFFPAPARERDAVVVGWMGTQGNFPNLRRILPSLISALATVPNGRLRIVSNAELAEYRGHPLVEQVRWTAATEVSDLHSFDVGLMPLVDSPATRGKCGFKMIQYMSVGIPVLSSAVGANVEILGDQRAGRLMKEGEDWGQALLDFLSSPTRMKEMGQRGRERVCASYSVTSAVDTLVGVLERVASSRRSVPHRASV